jgi:hypothetical protein
LVLSSNSFILPKSALERKKHGQILKRASKSFISLASHFGKVLQHLFNWILVVFKHAKQAIAPGPSYLFFPSMYQDIPDPCLYGSFPFPQNSAQLCFYIILSIGLCWTLPNCQDSPILFHFLSFLQDFNFSSGHLWLSWDIIY